ncbi:hypothetical protein Vau01_122010 [Virgisporangium aurantiacum]|uniref:Uncharacterized protein n=1 Tax=Virgisporangium aurantiacum TaxID=175570 RepID=A0A8J3ZNH6_9ACTN|nr:hypothetical protein Vau01_122010 [Virgisporangium aurantiacum]
MRAEALPHFERYGSFDGHFTFLQERIVTLAGRGGKWIDINVDEAWAYIHLIRGDMADATAAASTPTWRRAEQWVHSLGPRGIRADHHGHVGGPAAIRSRRSTCVATTPAAPPTPCTCRHRNCSGGRRPGGQRT